MTVAAEKPAPRHYPDSRRGVWLMLAAVGAFSIMDTMLKVLAARYPAAQVSGLRGCASLPFILGLYALRGSLAKLRMQTPGLHLLRGLLGIAMMMSFVYAVGRQSLTGVYAIYMIAPLLIVALAALLLGEKVDLGLWLAVLTGFAGVWLMLRPGAADFVRGASLAALGSALCYAIAALTARRLTRTDTSESMIVSFLVILSLGATALAWPGWVRVQTQDWLWLAAIGAVGAVAQHCITDAFRYASASTLAPMEYTALLYGLSIDWLVWSTAPSTIVLVGGLLVVAAGIYVVRRESVST
jgi:drug/metabolite transporter (DMT)-like permease